MQKILSLTLCLLFSIILNGQQKFTISGYIEDGTTGEKLIAANVFDAVSLNGTITNTYGFYSITLPSDSVQINFSYIGYSNQGFNLFLNKDIQMNISLQPSNALDVIEIVAEDINRIEERTEMSIAEVPISQIKKIPALMGEVDVLKALQLLPGVQSGGEGQSGLYVRGGSPDQNLILLDGVPVYNANHLFGFFSVFNADAIKDVKLTKGGFPARFGGRLSSVLEINMKEGNNKKFSGAGSLGIISSKLTLEGPLWKDKASFIISGRRTYIDILARPLIKYSFRQEGENSDGVFGYYFYDLNAKLNYSISDKDKVYLSSYFGNDKFYLKLTENDEDFSTKIGTDLGWGNSTHALRWNHLWSNRLFSNLTATYSQYNFGTGIESAQINRFEGMGEEGEEFGLSYTSGINDIALKLDFDYVPAPNQFVKFGGSSIRHNFVPGLVKLNAEFIEEGSSVFKIDTSFGQDEILAYENGMYIEDDIRLHPDLKINAGIHFSSFLYGNTNYTSFQPRLSLNYRLPGDMALKISYANMRQYVQFLTNESIGLPWDQWLPTTDRIVPQDSWQAAVGIAKTFRNTYEFSFEAYYKEMNNIISYEEGASLFSIEPWENLITQGEGKSYGGEFFIQKKKGKLSGWIGYTLSWSFRRFDNKNFGEWFPYKYDRRNDVSVVLIYELRDNLQLSGTWVYGTGNAYTFPESQIPILYVSENGQIYSEWVDYYDSFNNKRMAAYHRLDVNVDYIRRGKKMTHIWSFGAYNAYSRKNPFFLNLEEDYIEQPDGSYEIKKVLRQYSLFPIIPSISYRFEF